MQLIMHEMIVAERATERQMMAILYISSKRERTYYNVVLRTHTEPQDYKTMYVSILPPLVSDGDVGVVSVVGWNNRYKSYY